MQESSEKGQGWWGLVGVKADFHYSGGYRVYPVAPRLVLLLAQATNRESLRIDAEKKARDKPRQPNLTLARHTAPTSRASKPQYLV